MGKREGGREREREREIAASIRTCTTKGVIHLILIMVNI